MGEEPHLTPVDRILESRVGRAVARLPPGMLPEPAFSQSRRAAHENDPCGCCQAGLLAAIWVTKSPPSCLCVHHLMALVAQHTARALRPTSGTPWALQRFP